MKPNNEADAPRWPDHLKTLVGEIRRVGDDSVRSDLLGKIWLILNASISEYLRIHGTRLGKIPLEDAEDIAAQKSLEILRRIDLGTWETADATASKITGFLSRVARNGLVDRLRMEGRRVEPADEEHPEWEVADPARSIPVSVIDPPDGAVERKEFAAALRHCVEQLDPRSRLIWLFRVFAEMSSREIAGHPEVQLKVGHVDVLLQRSRQAVRNCVIKKGHDPEEMPPGTFIELWKSFRLEDAKVPSMQR